MLPHGLALDSFLFGMVVFTAIQTMPFIVQAKTTKTKTYYVLYDDEGRQPVCHCQKRETLPSPLLKFKEFESPGYLGTKQIEYSGKDEASFDAFEHYFRNQLSCRQASLEQARRQQHSDKCK